MVGIGKAQSPDEGLVHVDASGLYVHNGTGRDIIRFGLVESDGCRASQRAGVKVAARMVLARGHGMRDVESHPLNGRDGVQDPTIATVLGNINGCIATARNGIGSECRSDHDLWVGILDSEERFAVLIGFAAETCRDEVHKLDLDRRSIDRA